jgi:hypothetical protein
VDNAWEQYKLEARKVLENGDESHLSSARGVGLPAVQKWLCDLTNTLTLRWIDVLMSTTIKPLTLKKTNRNLMRKCR